MLKRFPKSKDILQVYAVIAVMLSAWTITAFLRKLPSWLLTLNLGEILTVFSYSMVANLVESLMVLLPLLLLCVLLPPRILRDDFAARGTILAIGFIGALMAFLGIYRQVGMVGPFKLSIGPLVIVLLTILLWIFSAKYPFLKSALLWLSDRLIVFLFILMPLYIILLAYVIFRNIA